MRPSTGHLVF